MHFSLSKWRCTFVPNFREINSTGRVWVRPPLTTVGPPLWTVGYAGPCGGRVAQNLFFSFRGLRKGRCCEDLVTLNVQEFILSLVIERREMSLKIQIWPLIFSVIYLCNLYYESNSRDTSVHIVFFMSLKGQGQMFMIRHRLFRLCKMCRFDVTSTTRGMIH